MEKWMPHRDYPLYSISNMGRVKNNKTKHILANITLPSGHIQVSIQDRRGYRITRSLGKLVAQVFVPNPRPKYFDTPIHLDGDIKNNEAENLMWRPRWFALKFTEQFKYEKVDINPIRNVNTGDVFSSIWGVVTRDGLLYSDVLNSIETKTPVFPTMDVFEWII